LLVAVRLALLACPGKVVRSSSGKRGRVGCCDIVFSGNANLTVTFGKRSVALDRNLHSKPNNTYVRDFDGI